MLLGILNYKIGEQVTIFLETFQENKRFSYLDKPIITRIILPNLSIASGFPKSMQEIDVGLFGFQLNLPIEKSAIGSYLIDVEWSSDNVKQIGFYQLIVSGIGQGNIFKATAG